MIIVIILNLVTFILLFDSQITQSMRFILMVASKFKFLFFFFLYNS